MEEKFIVFLAIFSPESILAFFHERSALKDSAPPLARSRVRTEVA